MNSTHRLKQTLQIVLLFGWVQALPAGEGFEARFRKQMDKKDLKKAGKVLDQWGKENPKDEERLAAEGNYHHVLAHLTDKDQDFEREVRLSAKSYETYLESKPARLDLWLALGDLYLDLGADESLLQLAQEITQHPPKSGWISEAGSNTPSAVKMMPDRFEDWGWGLIRERTEGADEWAKRLATLAQTKFPSHPGAYRILGRYWVEREKWDNAEKALWAAHERDDEDGETLLDLGRTLWELEKDQDAVACYQRVLALNNDPDTVRRAKEALDHIETGGE